MFCGVKPSEKVTCVNTEETIREGHMHEHGLLYTSVPFVMFNEGTDITDIAEFIANDMCVVVWCACVLRWLLRM